MYPAENGATVIWRGLQNGKRISRMVVLGNDGQPKGEPLDVGASGCATEDGMAWSEPGSGGRTRVVQRAWAAKASRDVAALGRDREPVLVCGAHRVFVLGQGDDDVDLAMSGDAGKARALVNGEDFGADEEREHDEFTVGDDLGIVRIGQSGAVALRETKGDALGAWHRLRHVIPADDDVVAVDGDERSVVVVTTRDAPPAVCGADGSNEAGTSVHALRIDRSTFDETLVDLAPAECGREVGPFWTGSVGPRLVVAWADRVTSREPTSAPIAGLSYRVLEGQVLGPIAHITRRADALVDAGCDRERCYAVALARAPGTTVMVPEVAQVITYP
jgi:hypothetical protein